MNIVIYIDQNNLLTVTNNLKIIFKSLLTLLLARGIILLNKRNNTVLDFKTKGGAVK